MKCPDCGYSLTNVPSLCTECGLYCSIRGRTQWCQSMRDRDWYALVFVCVMNLVLGCTVGLHAKATELDNREVIRSSSEQVRMLSQYVVQRRMWELSPESSRGEPPQMPSIQQHTNATRRSIGSQIVNAIVRSWFPVFLCGITVFVIIGIVFWLCHHKRYAFRSMPPDRIRLFIWSINILLLISQLSWIGSMLFG